MYNIWTLIVFFFENVFNEDKNAYTVFVRTREFWIMMKMSCPTHTRTKLKTYVNHIPRPHTKIILICVKILF